MDRLECRNISKAFGQLQALSDVSFTAYGGEIMALLGGNGSGKSTIAKIIAGVYRKDSGEVLFNDQKVETSSPLETKKAGIVITSQELSLLDNFDVAYNVCMSNLPTRSMFVDRKELEKKAMDVLKRCDMAEYWHLPVSRLNANEKYMVEFAKAIAQDPKILILDEITSALYSKDVAVVYDILKELREKGCIIIMITHRMNEIYAMCDSVTVLRNGEFICTVKTSEASENDLLFAMTGHHVEKAVFSEQEENELETGEEYRLSLDNHVLNGFNTPIQLRLRQGEVVCVAGLQGQGQSQLVRELFAIPGEIQYSMDGKEVSVHDPKDAVQLGIAFISGDREKEGTFSNRSIEENTTIVSDIVLKKKIEVNSALSRYKVRMDKTSLPIRSLSGGNQQKVVLARWTSSPLKVLLADDPTKGIDVNARMDVHKIIAELAEQGMSVVFSSSDEAELINLSKMCHRSRVIVMYGGQIVKTLTGDERTKENIFAYAIPQGETTL